MRSLPLLVLALVAGSFGGCRDAPSGVAGTWFGEANQWNDGDVTGEPDDTWTLRVSLDADPTDGGTVEYPSLKCGGTLAYVGPDSRGRSEAMVFRESLSHGTEGCADGGTVVLQLTGSTLEYGWSLDGSPDQATARLERE